MKSLTKRLINLALVICLVLPLMGCWDYESIAARASIIGIGIDVARDDPQKVEVTIQYPVLSQSAGDGESGSSTTPHTAASHQNHSTEAYSISEAMKTIQLNMDHKIETAQLQVIVLSGKLPSEMVVSVIEQLIRLPKLNHLAYIFMTPDSAKDVLTVQGMDSAPSDFLNKTMLVRQHGFVLRRKLWEFWRDMTQIGIVPILPIVRTVSSEESDGQTVTLDGAAVYLDNHVINELNPHQTFYVNLLSGKVRDMAFDTPVHGGIISLTDVRSKSHLRCLGEGLNLVLVDDVSIQGTLSKVADSKTHRLLPADLSKMQSETAEYLTQQLTRTLKQIQAQHSDIFGFGRIYFQHHPDEEQQIHSQWGERFSHAKIQVQVKVSIYSKGMLI